MKRIVSVIGARPQFIKAWPVSRELEAAGVEETVVHTGQHYDPDMSRIFFDEFGMREPDTNLGVGSGTQAVQTGDIMIGLEDFLVANQFPDWVLVYGDTNSTIAGALVATKLNIPVAHVEAGLRSFNRRMPEEINRVVTDRISNLLFCPTETAMSNLRREGREDVAILTGDVMRDAVLMVAAQEEAVDLQDIVSDADEFYLATIHRAENTDDPARLSSIFSALGQLDLPVVLPLHPRTRKETAGMKLSDRIRVVSPVGYREMLALVRRARKVLTDSGGLQKEALWLGTPCVTIRDETEWVETLVGNWNVLTGADETRIIEASKITTSGEAPQSGLVEGASASRRIASCLAE